MIIGSEGLGYGLGSIMTIHPHMVLTYTGIAEKPHGAELGGPKIFSEFSHFLGLDFLFDCLHLMDSVLHLATM